MSFPLVDEPLLKMLKNEVKAASRLISRVHRVHGVAEMEGQSRITGATDSSTLARIIATREHIQQVRKAAEEFLSS